MDSKVKLLVTLATCATLLVGAGVASHDSTLAAVVVGPTAELLVPGDDCHFWCVDSENPNEPGSECEHDEEEPPGAIAGPWSGCTTTHPPASTCMMLYGVPNCSGCDPEGPACIEDVDELAIAPSGVAIMVDNRVERNEDAVRTSCGGWVVGVAVATPTDRRMVI